MEELVILQEEENVRKVQNLYDAIVAATSYIDLNKSEKIETKKENYGKKPKPQLLAQ
jgi:hypothetical protein